MSFFPDNYTPPAPAGNYLRIEKDSQVRIRIISERPVIGFEAWTNDNKPLRWREQPAILPIEVRAEKDGTKRVREFLVMVVWDYADSKPKIWEITQTTIRNALFAFTKDPDFGHPMKYDLKVSRTDKSNNVTYSVVPANPLMIDGKLVLDMDAAQVAAAHINLNALFDGTNPFGETTPTHTAAAAPTTTLPPGAKAPAELITYLRQGAQRYESDPPLPDGWYSSLKSYLERIVGGTDERHAFIRWAFGAVSGDELSNGQWIMLKNWLRISKAADGKFYPDGVAKAEAEAAMAFLASKQAALTATEDMDEEIPF